MAHDVRVAARMQAESRADNAWVTTVVVSERKAERGRPKSRPNGKGTVRTAHRVRFERLPNRRVLSELQMLFRTNPVCQEPE